MMKNTAKYNQKLEEILKSSATVFSCKGFHCASIRDISRVTEMSLAGLYHYFKSKDEILYMIQDHAFGTIVSKLKDGLQNISDPEEKLRFLINNHLDYFLNHMDELKICAHEMETLQGEFYEEVASKRREYFRMARDIVKELNPKAGGEDVDWRVDTLQLFGNLNWVYMWYNPQIDLPTESLARIMADNFLYGIKGSQIRRSGSLTSEHASNPPTVGGGKEV